MGKLILPNRRLERPASFRPNIKPTWPVEIDWDHPFSRIPKIALFSDSSGVTNLIDGTKSVNVNSPTISVGSGGQKIDYNGTNQYSKILAGPGINFADLCNGDMTISIRLQTLASNNFCFGFGSSSNSIPVFLLQGDDQARCFVRSDNNSASNIRGGPNINDGISHTIVIQRKGPVTNLHTDGALVATESRTHTNWDDIDLLTLGGLGRSSYSNFWAGSFYEINIWDSFLSASEIARQYQDPFQFLIPK